MARADIGEIDCPICGKSGAHVRETDKGRAYVVCDECVVQIFARGPASDKAIRAAMKPEIVEEKTPIDKTILPSAVEKKPPAPVVDFIPPETPEEKTIFDFLMPKGAKK